MKWAPARLFCTFPPVSLTSVSYQDFCSAALVHLILLRTLGGPGPFWRPARGQPGLGCSGPFWTPPGSGVVMRPSFVAGVLMMLQHSINHCKLQYTSCRAPGGYSPAAPGVGMLLLQRSARTSRSCAVDRHAMRTPCLVPYWYGGSELLPQRRCGRHLPPGRSAVGGGRGTGSSHPRESWQRLSGGVVSCYPRGAAATLSCSGQGWGGGLLSARSEHSFFARLQPTSAAAKE